MSDCRIFRWVFLLSLVFLFPAETFSLEFQPIEKVNHFFQESMDYAKNYLLSGLVFPRCVSRVGGQRLPDAAMFLYVLGGTQDSLIYKLKTVGQLYAGGMVKKILVLHRPGITEYSPKLQRNLINDEWVIEKLKEDGVASERVEFVSVPPGVFDTFAEARVISALARSRQMKHLVLVSSSHHTKRVWISFSHFNADNRMELYIYGSEEPAEIIELLIEGLKLMIYRYLVLPIDRILQFTSDLPLRFSFYFRKHIDGLKLVKVKAAVAVPEGQVPVQVLGEQFVRNVAVVLVGNR